MSKKSSSTSSIDNTSNINSTGFSSNTNIQNNNQQDVDESVNRALDQTKDNINRSIDESKNQIPQYNNIVNSYQEQTLQAVKEISENYIESQKSIINSFQSAWRPFNQNINTTVNTWNSPETVANAYSRLVSTCADNAVTYLRTTNNLVFASLDAYKTTMQHAKENTKHIFNQNVNAAKTFEQNSKSRFNTSVNTSSGSSNTRTTSSTTTSTSAA